MTRIDTSSVWHRQEQRRHCINPPAYAIEHLCHMHILVLLTRRFGCGECCSYCVFCASEYKLQRKAGRAAAAAEAAAAAAAQQV